MSDSSQKSGGCWLPIIGAIVLLGGGAAAYWAVKENRSGDLTAEANAAVLPDETAAIVHIDVASLDKLAAFGTPEAQTQLQNARSSVLAEISPELDWERDLKPWVGSLTLGITESSLDANSRDSNGADTTQGYLAIGIRDKVRALQFARSMESKAGDSAVKSEYGGVEILQLEPETDREMTVAILGDRLLLAGPLAEMQSAIDDINANTTASTVPEFQDIFGRAEDTSDTLLRLYIPNTDVFAERDVDGNIINSGGDVSVQASIATLDVADNGLHGRVRVFLEGDGTLSEFVTLSDRAETQFPEQTLLLLAGNNIGATWTQLVARAEAPDAPPEASQALALFREGFASIGLDADREVFAWLDGEAAFGAFPVQTGLLQQLGVAAAATFETDDRPTASATMKKLADTVNDRVPVPLKAGKRQIGDVEVNEWTIPVPGMGSGGLFGYGWRDDRNLIVGLSAPALDALVQPAEASLADNPNFQDVMQDLPSEKSSYAYFNLAQIDRLLQEIPASVPTGLSPETVAPIGATRGLGITIAADGPDRLSIDMALVLKRLDESPAESSEATENEPE